MKVSIIVPVYNEFRTFNEVLERILAAPLPRGCSKEVVIVDDGSTDGTTQVLRDVLRANNGTGGIILGHYSQANAGKGAAIRIALTISTGDIVLIQDGDLEYDPQEYSRVLQPIVDGRVKVVYGSRFLGKASGMAFKNWIANKVLTAAANILYGAGLTDEATAYKAFDAALLRSLHLECRHFDFCPEVTAKLRRLDHRILEVPITYNARGIADGKKIRVRDGFEALWTLIKYRFLPLRVQAQASAKLMREQRI